LAGLNALHLRDGDWQYDLDKIRKTLERAGFKPATLLSQPPPQERRATPPMAKTIVFGLVIGSIGAVLVLIYFLTQPRPPPRPGRGIMGPLLWGVQLKGSNLSQMPIRVASAEECSEKCAKREDCVAMTFVKGAGHCWLKNAVPPQSQNSEMVSAIKKP
jgi:hypothetical protein